MARCSPSDAFNPTTGLWCGRSRLAMCVSQYGAQVLYVHVHPISQPCGSALKMPQLRASHST